jgi:hypothetical protein
VERQRLLFEVIQTDAAINAEHGWPRMDGRFRATSFVAIEKERVDSAERERVLYVQYRSTGTTRRNFPYWAGAGASTTEPQGLYLLPGELS